jgi:hypothetical protein
MTWIDKLNPAVPRSWLQIVAGLAWSGVGLMLGRWAAVWLLEYPLSTGALAVGAGLGLAVLISLFFSIMALKNIDRINQLPEKACLFAFQQWYSYPLVLFMVSLGLLLRHSPLPRNLLAILYLGIGGGLLLASRHYYLTLAAQDSHLQNEPLIKE